VSAGRAVALMGAALAAGLLNACAGVVREEPQAPAAAAVQPVAAAAVIKATVEVTPRLGLFSVLTYENQEQFERSIQGGPMAKLGFDRKNGSLVERNQAGALSYLPERWQWIPEPVANGFKANPKPDFDAALKSRHVKVTVTANDCRWDEAPPGVPDAGCAFEFHLATNHSARLAGRADGRQVRFGIPADVLVVSMGDSYASGEGNPDRPILSKREVLSEARPIGLSKPAWMDQRCHRSLWSGPAQAVLRLSRASCTVTGDKARAEALAGIPEDMPCEAVEVSDDLTFAYRGNYTFISLACSGAEIMEGVLAEYGGRERIAEMRRLLRDESARGDDSRLPLLRGENAAVPYELRRLPPQTHRLAQVVNTHGGAVRHLIMSLGGNDINFGGILTDYLSSPYPQCEGSECGPEICEHPRHSESIFCQHDRVAAGDLKLLRDRLYPELATKLYAFGLANVQTIYLTQYPDPMRCENGKYCSGATFLGLGPFEAIAADFGAGLTAAKGAHAVAKVVTPLNQSVDSMARTQGWALVGGLQDKFGSSGWCTSAGSDQYDPAMLRNFRTLADSVAVQGSLSGDYFFSTGAMHPNFLGHATIAEHVIAAFRKTPLVAAADIETEPKVEGGYVGSRFRVLLPKTAHPNVDPLIEIDVASSAQCKGRQCTIAGAGAGPRSLVLRGRDVDGKWFEAIRGVIVDTTGPEIRIAPEPGEKWSVDPLPLRFAVTASDTLRAPAGLASKSVPPSGFGRWMQCDVTDMAGTEPKGPCTGVDLTRDVLELEFRNDGDFLLQVAAEDRVGNSSADAEGHKVGHSWRIRRDSTPPVIEQAMLGGITIDYSPLIVVNHPRPTLEFQAFDKISGISELVFDWGNRSLRLGACEGACARGRVTVRRLLELDEELPEKRRIPALLQVTDVAGHLSNPRTLSLVYAPRKSTRRSAQTWQGNLPQAGRLLALVAQSSLRFAGRTELPPAADADWPLLAAWLNLFDGRMPADRQLPLDQARSCLGGQRALPAGHQPALRVLEYADACWGESSAAAGDLLKPFLP